MEDRKIYSLNRIAFLIANNIEVVLFKDDDDKIFAIVEEDVSKLFDNYNKDVVLHSFLGAYRELRLRIKELR